MLNLYYTEVIKLKRSPVSAIIAIIIVLPLLLQFVISMGIFSNGKTVGWFDILATHEFLINLLLAPPCFGLIAGYIFAREYQENTINLIFTSSYSRIKVYTAKLLLLLPLILFTLVISYVLLVVLGLFLTSEGLTLKTLMIHSQNLLLITVWQFALCIIAIIPAILMKNSYSSMVVGAGGVAISIITVLTSVPLKYSAFNPYYFPAYLVSQLTTEQVIPGWILWRGLATMGFIGLVCLSLTFYRYTQSDVQSGS